MTLALVVAGTLAFVRFSSRGGVDDAAVRPPVAPAAGPVRIRALTSGLCLDERPDSRSGRVYGEGCTESTVVRFGLRRLTDSTWRLATDHRDYGDGCSGIWDGGTAAGAALQDQECGKRGSAEAFRIEPFGSPVKGYRVRPAHTGLCLGMRGGEARQLACAADGEGQLFSFDPDRA
ncbi:RICIN domain-containing protein [Streptomyces flavofungini]|uniref:RICIN domain-containing protein n=1 Tax=Streptomyces flavofungini TaxID=68200 RepID=UPI0034DE79B0